MLAVVKTPRTEVMLSGVGADAVIEFLKTKFMVEIVSEDGGCVSGDDELVDANKTEWAKENKFRVLAGARLKIGLTQKQVADLTGFRQSVVCEYENGKRKMTRNAAVRFAKALGTSPDKLFN
ncbi:MAG: helix-turn-helix transcriptional regulator [Victivallaceae bacterium]|nr:helix-turn-helix transcriptional regulator [Victivallaceae bacterium]